MFMRCSVMACAVWLVACGDDVPQDAGKVDASTGSAERPSKAAGQSGTAAAANGGASGATGRRPPTACMPLSDAEKQVTCGGELCPTSAKHETDPCFVPCCVRFEGAERCGFRGTSPATAAFTTECVLPAVSDPSCDEVPQFEGCCEPTQHICGVIGGFAPGCQTKSRFVTLPDPPKACGLGGDADAGPDSDAGR